MKKEYIYAKGIKYDKSHLTWKDDTLGWEGVVYRYQLNMPNSTENGWSYIGCTPEEETRKSKWRQQNNKYAGKVIAEARKRYGIKNFTYSVLETLYDTDLGNLVTKLEKREAYYISKYNSVENGYNSSSGGTGRKGQKLSEEEIQKIKNKRKGFRHTEEAKKKISESQKGRKVSDETKQKISAGNKGKKRTDEQNKAQSERMKGKIPIAAKEGADRWREVNGGSYWKGKKMPPEARANMKKVQQERGIKVKAIFLDGAIKEFSTMLDAAKGCGVMVGSVSHCINNGGTCKNGIKFERL